MSEWPFDRAEAERWFAVEFNNEAWALVEAGTVPVEKVERLLHLAHAACLHWSQVGTPINRQRALDLLAHAYAGAGLGEIALKYAESAWQLSLRNADEQTAFDQAEAMSTMAVALRAAGQSESAESWKQKAIAEISRLGAEDRAVIERLMSMAEARLPIGDMT